MVNLDIVERDYGGNLPNVTDSYRWYHNEDGTVDDDGGVTYLPVEWNGRFAKPRGGFQGIQAAGVVFLRGTTGFTLKMTIRNSITNTFVAEGSFTFQQARLDVPVNDVWDDWLEVFLPGPPEYINLTITPNTTHNFALAPGEEVAYTYSLEGLPQHVALGQLQIIYDMPVHEQGSSYWQYNGTFGTFATKEWIYVVDQAPIGLQQTPFVDFLNFTCRWAYGAVSKFDVWEKMTKGMHYSNRSPEHRLAYNTGFSPIVYTYSGGSRLLKLRKFVRLMNNSAPWVEMDCRDFANVLALAMQSQGHEGYAAYIAPAAPYAGLWFETHPICPAGTDSSATQYYNPCQFNFHTTASESMNIAAGLMRYDSSNSYLYFYLSPVGSGQPYMNPAVGWFSPQYWMAPTGLSLFGLADYVHSNPNVHVADAIESDLTVVGLGTWIENGAQ